MHGGGMVFLEGDPEKLPNISTSQGCAFDENAKRQ
jgi:hypothetical protein